MPAQLLFCVEQLVGCCVFEFFPPLFYWVQIWRVWWQELYKYVVFFTVVAYHFCFMPGSIIHNEKEKRIFAVQAFQELEELF